MQLKDFFTLSFLSKKTKRIILWVAGIIAGLYLLLLIGLGIYISYTQQKLVSTLKTKLNDATMGELKIGEAEVTMWQTFPNLGVIFRNVTMTDSVYHLPYLQAKSITVKAGLFGLIGNNVKINSVILQGAVLHTFIDSSGYTNRYVFNPKLKPKTQSKKPLVISNIILKNVTAISEDAIKNKKYQVKFTSADIDIKLRGSKYFIRMNEDAMVGGLGFNLAKGYWLQNQRLQGIWKLEYNTESKTLSFNENKVIIAEQPFILKGAFYFNAPAHFHLEASTKNIVYAKALAMLKPTTSEKLKKINLSEPLDASVLLDGLMAYKSIPLVKVDFKTEGNSISTPVINFSGCNFSGNFINNVNPDSPFTDANSRISIHSFSSEWGDINLTAKNIVFTNFLQPDIRFEFYSQCTLEQLDEQLASSTLRFLNGNASLYLSYNGPLITGPEMLEHLNAKISIQDGKMIYIPRNLTLSGCNGTIAITQNALLVNQFQCNLNTSHFIVNVTGNNLNSISGDEPGKTIINCNVSSPLVNLADLKSIFAKRPTPSIHKKPKSIGNTISAIDNAVADADFNIELAAKQLVVNNFRASNVSANAVFTNNGWEIKKATMQHADGSFQMEASVHHANNGVHEINTRINLQHINIKKLLYGFNNFGQTTLTSANLKGILNAEANITAGINTDGKLVTNNMNGRLIFSLKDAALHNFKPLMNIQSYIFKNRDLSNVEFAELKDTFDIQNGDIYIKRMPVQSTALTLYLEGIYSFEDRTDLSIQVPLSTLTKNPGDVSKIKTGKTHNPGASIYLRAKEKNGQVKIGLDVFRKKRDKESKE